MEKIQKKIEDLPTMLDATDIQLITKLSRAGVYNLINSGAFPTLRIGKRVVVPKDAFIRWIEERTRAQIQSKEVF